MFGRTSNAPRDQRFPAAHYWPGGILPGGPEYEAPAVAQFTYAEAAD